MRAGVGVSGDGDLGEWQKNKIGRLGNESDTYSELELGSEVYKKNGGAMPGFSSGSGKMDFLPARSLMPLTGHGSLPDKIATCRLKKTGLNPTVRGKQGVKRSLMTDANGLPLSLVVAGANTQDIKLVEDTLDALETGRPGCRLRLCMDKGYEAEWLENS